MYTDGTSSQITMKCQAVRFFILLVLLLILVFRVDSQKTGPRHLSRLLQPARQVNNAQPQCAFCNPGGRRCPSGCHVDESGRKCVPDANCRRCNCR